MIKKIKQNEEIILCSVVLLSFSWTLGVFMMVRAWCFVGTQTIVLIITILALISTVRKNTYKEFSGKNINQDIKHP